MKYIDKAKEIFTLLRKINSNLDIVKTSLGRIEDRQINGVNNIEYKVFSQWGEDGIIQHLIQNINIKNKIFIEFGVENYTESNTRFLLINDKWSGLIIDGSEKNINYVKNDDIYWRYNLKAECAFITAENINDLFKKNGINGDIGILSIDIDGNDYWVWKAIDCVNPDIVICEYNHRFGKDAAVTVPYDPQFLRNDKHYSCIYYGASIKALVKLANEKGYSLVAGNKNGNNVFFVKNELLNDKIKSKTIDDVFVHATFRETRNTKGELTYASLEDEMDILNNLELVKV